MGVTHDLQPIPVEAIPDLGHAEAMALAATEFDRIVALLRSLSAAEWSAPTACTLWDVRAMTAHVLGMAEAQASLRRFASDFRAAGKRDGGAMIDAMTGHQVAQRAAMTPGDIVERLAVVAPKAVAARRRTPRLLRNAVTLRQDPPFEQERWRYGYLVDVIFTRDTWMHRLDICRATGRPMQQTATHDGRIVSNVVAEWARRHGKPFELTLTGPAGGRWRQGRGGQCISLDTTDFCWTLAGRLTGNGLLATPVPF